MTFPTHREGHSDMKLLRKFKRDESPLRLPLAIGPGVSYGDGGVWSWVEIPPRSTDELDAATLIAMTHGAAGDLPTAIRWASCGAATGDDYRREEIAPGMTG